MSADSAEKLIETAFKVRGLTAVALAINSPGGSPVQSHLIMRSIRRAAAEASIPVFAFVEDVGASGGYMLALAADEIYADGSSIVGSIGVVAAGFGFQEAIARLGVERRVHTAGQSKSQLDPFRPEKEEDVRRLDALLVDIHRLFIDLVKERRREKLKDPGDVFTGAFWTGRPAFERGLIDGVDSLDDFVRRRYGEDVRVKKIEEKSGVLRRIFGGASQLVDDALVAIEDRDVWSRYRL